MAWIAGVQALLWCTARAAGPQRGLPCTHTRTLIGVYLYIHIFIYLSVHTYIYVHKYSHMYTDMHMYILYIYIDISLNIHCTLLYVST